MKWDQLELDPRIRAAVRRGQRSPHSSYLASFNLICIKCHNSTIIVVTTVTLSLHSQSELCQGRPLCFCSGSAEVHWSVSL